MSTSDTPVGKLTIITTTTPATLGKTYTRNESGQVVKTVAGQMVAGHFAVQTFDNAPALADVLLAVSTSQALCASLPINGKQCGQIVSRARQAAKPEALTRTKDQWTFAAGQPGVLVLDYDPAAEGTPLSLGEVWAALVAMFPDVDKGGAVGWVSGSSFIYNGDTLVNGARGCRVYLMVQDLADTKRVMAALTSMSWLAGHGRVEVSASGSMLKRSLFDEAMAQEARLDFIGGAVCVDPLSQRRGTPVILASGSFIDTRTIFPDVDANVAAQVDMAIEKAKAGKRNAAQTAREGWMSKQVGNRLPKLLSQGLPAGEAEDNVRRLWTAAFAGTLLGDFDLTLVDAEGAHEQVTVSQLLAQPDAFHERDCLDPINPEHRDGASDCRLFLLSASPIAYSLDDGGKVYQLRKQADRIVASKGQRAALVTAICAAVVTWPDVYRCGPEVVQVDGSTGRVGRLTVHRLSLLIDSRCALYVQGAAGKTAPIDVARDVAELCLAALA